MSKRSLALLLSALMVLLVFTGCNQKVETPPNNEPEVITVTDIVGNVITLDEVPQRIGSAAVIPTYVLLSLGVQDNIVMAEIAKPEGRQSYLEFSSQTMLDNWASAGGRKNFNVETAISIAPDFVILPVTQTETMEQLAAAGITTFIGNPETFEEMQEFVTQLGIALGVEERASDLLGFYDRISDDISERLAGLSDEDKPEVYMNGSSDLLNSLTANMFQADLVNAAGGKLVSEDLTDVYWVKISPEQLQVYNPEVIIMPAECDFTPQDWIDEGAYQNLTAVQDGSIYRFPSFVDSWDFPIPTSCLGLAWLANQLHPELVPADVVEGYIVEYYNTFFGKDFTMDYLQVTLR